MCFYSVVGGITCILAGALSKNTGSYLKVEFLTKCTQILHCAETKNKVAFVCEFLEAFTELLSRGRYL